MEIDRLAVWLEQESDGLARRASQAAGNRPVDQPSLSPSADLLDHLYGDLIAFETAWRVRQGYAQIKRMSQGRRAHDRAVTLAFLSSNLTRILKSEEMVHHLLKIFRWRVVIQHAAHAEPERVDRPGRCPRCHLVNVLWTDHVSDIIRCRSCPIELTEDEYEAEVVADPDPVVVAESRRVLGLVE